MPFTNRIKVTATGVIDTMTLGTAVDSFVGFPNGSTYYTILADDNTWQIGQGTVSASILTIDSVEENSNGDFVKVDFTGKSLLIAQTLTGSWAENHVHTESDISDLDKYTQSQVNSLLSSKEDSLPTITTDNTYLKGQSNGSMAWEYVENIWVGDDPPGNKEEYKQWLKTDTGEMWYYYDDGDSSQWISEVPNMTEEVGGGTVSGLGVWPIFTPLLDNSSGKVNSSTPDYMPGHLGNGDYFRLPAAEFSSSNYVLRYYDNSNIQIYEINPEDINASCDVFMGFTYDATDDELYLIAGDTTLDTIYLATVGVTGTITVLGSDTAPTGISTNHAYYGGSSYPYRMNSMNRVADGSGNFILMMLSTRTEVDITGTIVSNVSEINSDPGLFLTDQGIYFSLAGRTNQEDSAIQSAFIRYRADDGVLSAKTLLVPIGTGLPDHENRVGSIANIWWKDGIYLVSDSSVNGPRKFDKQVFNDAINQLATNLGILT